MDNLSFSNSEAEHIHHVQPENIGQRLDRYLVSVLQDISRTGIQQLITDEKVLVNGKPTKSGYLLRLHDEIVLAQLLPVSGMKYVTPHVMPLDIVYEDKDLIVVNKAAGVVVHPAPGHQEDTLVNALVARFPELQNVGGDMRPGIVHRLDKDTSGLLIVARNAPTLAKLTEAMQRHEIIKRYLALVEGIVSLEQGSIDAPIGRDPRNRQQMTITTIESREARTHFRVLKRFARHTLLQVQLETGRTHQIRVHLQAIRHPVAGDPVYGLGRSIPGLALHRQFLHAYQLLFTHPTTGDRVECEVGLPPDLQSVLDHETVL